MRMLRLIQAWVYMLNWISHSIVAVIGSVLSNKLQTLDIAKQISEDAHDCASHSLILALTAIPIASALLPLINSDCLSR